MSPSGEAIFKTRSPGKLMLTGEYLALQGALALALPVNRYQSLEVYETDKDVLEWETWHEDTRIFHNTFTLPHFAPIDFHTHPSTLFITSLLKAAFSLNPDFREPKGFRIRTQMEFDPAWGWGSSSSLIVNTARWTGTDPFELHRNVSQGSGYDIAVAFLNSAVLYSNHPFFRIQAYDIDYPFSDHLYLLYLGRKQDTAKSLLLPNLNRRFSFNALAEADEITLNLAGTNKVDTFSSLLKAFEDIISKETGLPVLQKNKFPDFEGYLKPLGAWGGDFALVVWEEEEQKLRDYFVSKGLTTLFRWNECISGSETKPITLSV